MGGPMQMIQMQAPVFEYLAVSVEKLAETELGDQLTALSAEGWAVQFVLAGGSRLLLARVVGCKINQFSTPAILPAVGSLG